MLAMVDEDKRNHKWTDWVLDSKLIWVSLDISFHQAAAWMDLRDESGPMVKNAPLNYTVRFSGPVTALAWRPNKSMQNL
jgi:hypothetical protein